MTLLGIIIILVRRRRGRRPLRLAGSLALSAALAAAVPGCSGGATAPGGRVSVVASFYPLAEAAQRVGGRLVAVTNLTPPGVEPHDLELDPNEVGDIADADVVLYLGGGFQPAVQDAVSAAAEGERVDLLQGMPTIAGTTEEGASSGDSIDPHVWLDPTLMRRIVGRVAAALSSADPSHRSTYARNASSFVTELGRLADAYETGLSSCRRRDIVTTHAAFGYLAERYGLAQQPITGLSPEAEPDPKRLASLISMVERDGTTTIYTEPLVSSKVAETLAQETGATTASLNPLEGLTPTEVRAGDDYISVMRANLAALERGLGCS
jgi:zinc transport system substrate-binding protein